MERRKLLDDIADKHYYQREKNEKENMRRENTYNDHPMGNKFPKGVGDHNRGEHHMPQHKGKVMQQYYGSQQNPPMDEYETVPFNIDRPRYHL